VFVVQYMDKETKMLQEQKASASREIRCSRGWAVALQRVHMNWIRHTDTRERE
jgi:hypothetical protein